MPTFSVNGTWPAVELVGVSTDTGKENVMLQRIYVGITVVRHELTGSTLRLSEVVDTVSLDTGSTVLASYKVAQI